MRFRASARSDVGQRRKNNEDSVYADSDAGLFIVADGMGGHAAGEVASGMAVEIVCSLFAGEVSPEDPLQLLKEAFSEATRAICQRATGEPACKGMGTTLSALFFQGSRLYLAHVGDSRIYRLRAGVLEQLSIDHSLVAEQVRQGLISAAEARASNIRNILLQAVGLEEQVDPFLLQQHAQAGDTYLLCSDGLTDMLEDDQIEQQLGCASAPDQLAQGLIDSANAAGGCDNIGVVVIRVEG